jgi:beta-lactamase class A
MNSKGFILILRWVSLVFIFAASVLVVLQLVSYSRIRTAFPPGMVIAGVPVGGLDAQQAADRITQAYSVPVELQYNNARIQIKPASVGFELQMENMLADADSRRISQPFWSAFWDYLWNRLPTPSEVPLMSSISEDRLRTFLHTEIAARYDLPSTESVPVPGSVNFQPGEAGTALDVERAVQLIKEALASPSKRIVSLSYKTKPAIRPSFQNLQILLQQIMDMSGASGLAEIYIMDLNTNQELNFAWKKGGSLPPGIAFTAASTMKIPIMVSALSRAKEPVSKEIITELELMLERSENPPADKLMAMIEENLGPLSVTDDMNKLGLTSTFIAGYFYPGAPLLRRIETPGNKRTDVSTNPDAYNQTTPAELGMLLDDIYQCSETGGGTLPAVFGDQINQNKCRQMLAFMTRNKIGVLLEAGLPEGTRIAHKHGWITEQDGLIHSIGDAGIIYTPGGNYVMTVFLYNQDQLLFDPANALIAQLSTATYNYFNMGSK